MDTPFGNFITTIGKSAPDWVRFPIQRRVFDRIPKVASLVGPDETILDIGCARHKFDADDWETPPPGVFLHEDLANTSDRVVGIDIVKEAVEEMRSVGYDVRTGDAHDFTLDEEFDTVVAAEVIEHLENPGIFLTNCKRHLKEGGRILLTTPNPRRIQLLVSYLIYDHPAKNEHTMWFDPFVIDTLAARVDLEVTRTWTYSPGISPLSLLSYYAGVASPVTAGGWIFELRPDE